MKKTSAVVSIAVLFLVALVAVIPVSNRRSVRASNAGASTPQCGPAPSSNPWQVPCDITSNPSQQDYWNFGWQNFVALAWPASPVLSTNPPGQMGQPDTNLKIGATASNGALVPAVWNTFREVSTIMLAAGQDPGSNYSQPVKLPTSCPALGSGNPVAPGFQPLYIDNSTFSTQMQPNAMLVRSTINQASTGPLVDQEGWYTFEQIFVGPSEYAYIQGNGYYKGLNQEAAFQKNHQLVGLPQTPQGMNMPSYAQYGALEVKATWRVLNPATDANIIPRYYTQWGYFMQADGKTCEGPNLFGLIGMHIIRLTPTVPATWFWSTFEQVDNITPPAQTPPIPATLAASGTPPPGSCTKQYNHIPNALWGNIPWNGSNKPNNICQVTPIPSAVQAVNQQWQSQLKGTVWQYYQMVNTVNPCLIGGITPCSVFPPIYSGTDPIDVNVMANTAIESYVQNTTCLNCHGYAAGDGAPSKLTGTNQIFTFVLQNAFLPSLTEAAAGRESLLRVFQNPPPTKPAVAPKSKPVEKYKQ